MVNIVKSSHLKYSANCSSLFPVNEIHARYPINYFQELVVSKLQYIFPLDYLTHKGVYVYESSVFFLHELRARER